MNKCDFCDKPCEKPWCPTKAYIDCAEPPPLIPYEKGRDTDK